MFNIDEFAYPLPKERRDQIIADHEKAWIDHFLNESVVPRAIREEDYLYDQACIEQSVLDGEECNQNASRDSFTHSEIRNAMKIVDMTTFVTADGVKRQVMNILGGLAEQIDPLGAAYAPLLRQRTNVSAPYLDAFVIKYYKGIALGKDVKEAYRYALGHAHDRFV